MSVYSAGTYSAGIYGGSTGVAVRELPPLRLGVLIFTPGGRCARWAGDDPKAENMPQGLRGSSTTPGGFETCDCKLAREPGVDYSDLVPLSTLRVEGAGGEVAGEYRLERTPRVSGDQIAISPSAVGWQAHLEDNKAVRALYVDRDLSRWRGASVQRRLNYASAGSFAVQDDPSALPDATSGAPSLRLGWNGGWGAAPGLPVSEALYDANGVPIGEIYYAWKKNGNVDHTGGGWSWTVRLTDDDVDSARDSSAELRAAGPGSGRLAATVASRRFALLRLSYGTGVGGTDGVDYSLFETCLAVYGNNAVPLHGTDGATQAKGVLAADVVAHAVGTFAPLLDVGQGTIDPTAFVIEQLAFLDPTTAGEIVRQATRFGLEDWAVWESRAFHLHARGSYGRNWLARVGPAKLEETGPQVDRIWNSIVVQYTDVDGTTRTVGPLGSGADVESGDLVDADPLNPANEIGATRRDLLVMGTAVAAAAIEVGRRFLEQSKLLDTSGRAELTGYVLDDRGVLRPYWEVRAGDTVTFIDASDPSPRRVVKADWTDETKTCSVDLDSPPEGLQALLERLGVVLVPLGIS